MLREDSDPQYLTDREGEDAGFGEETGLMNSGVVGGNPPWGSFTACPGSEGEASDNSQMGEEMDTSAAIADMTQWFNEVFPDQPIPALDAVTFCNGFSHWSLYDSLFEAIFPQPSEEAIAQLDAGLLPEPEEPTVASGPGVEQYEWEMARVGAENLALLLEIYCPDLLEVTEPALVAGGDLKEILDLLYRLKEAVYQQNNYEGSEGERGMGQEGEREGDDGASMNRDYLEDTYTPSKGTLGRSGHYAQMRASVANLGGPAPADGDWRSDRVDSRDMQQALEEREEEVRMACQQQAQREARRLREQHEQELDAAVEDATKRAWAETRKYSQLYEDRDRECMEQKATIAGMERDQGYAAEAVDKYRVQIGRLTKDMEEVRAQLKSKERLARTLQRSIETHSKETQRHKSKSMLMSATLKMTQQAREADRKQRQKEREEALAQMANKGLPASDSERGTGSGSGGSTPVSPSPSAAEEALILDTQHWKAEAERLTQENVSLTDALETARQGVEKGERAVQDMSEALAREKDRYDASRTEYYSLHRTLDHMVVAMTHSVKGAFRSSTVPVAVMQPPSVSQINPWLTGVREALSQLQEKALLETHLQTQQKERELEREMQRELSISSSMVRQGARTATDASSHSRAVAAMAFPQHAQSQVHAKTTRPTSGKGMSRRMSVGNLRVHQAQTEAETEAAIPRHSTASGAVTAEVSPERLELAELDGGTPAPLSIGLGSGTDTPTNPNSAANRGRRRSLGKTPTRRMSITVGSMGEASRPFSQFTLRRGKGVPETIHEEQEGGAPSLMSESVAAVRALKVERDSLAEERDTLLGVRQTLETERDTLAEERDALASERDSLMGGSAVIVKERDTLQSQVESVSGERDTLVRERDSLTAERDCLAEAKVSLTQQAVQLTAERDTAVEQRDSLAEEREALLGERETMRQEGLDVTRERDVLREERDSLAGERATIIEQRDQAATERDSLRRAKYMLAEERSALRYCNTELVKERDGLVVERDSLVQERLALRAESAGLLQERDTLAASVESIDRDRAAWKKERETLTGERDVLRVERYILAEERNTLKKDRDTLREEKEALIGERDSIAAERDAYIGDRVTLIGEWEGVKVERDSLTEERDTLRGASEALTAERDSLLVERQGLTGERDSLTAERDTLVGVTETLTLEWNTLARAKKTLTAERDTLATERDTLATERDT
ncbi:hypothetical protein KIPB_002702, partial [Kipferlia bialata]|eukprot:g2702.t1